MSATKQAVESLLGQLPDNCSFEDVQYHLYVLENPPSTSRRALEQMAYSVVWSPNALDDVDEIAAYIARDSPTYAAAVVEKILDITRNLQKFPLLGRIVPESNEESIRERFVYSYRLIYQVQQETITIIAVVHGKRLLENENMV
jgi:toxin ParE1/3/4